MKSPNGENWPMMIIAHKCACAKGEKLSPKKISKKGSSLFTEAKCPMPAEGRDHKVWDHGRHNSSIYTIFCNGNQKFSPTSTWFSTGKNPEKPRFSPIINQLTEKLQNKFVTFHGYGFLPRSAIPTAEKEKCTISEAEILRLPWEKGGRFGCKYHAESVK